MGRLGNFHNVRLAKFHFRCPAGTSEGAKPGYQSASFDYLIRAGDQRCRDINTERLGCSKVDCELKSCRFASGRQVQCSEQAIEGTWAAGLELSGRPGAIGVDGCSGNSLLGARLFRQLRCASVGRCFWAAFVQWSPPYRVGRAYRAIRSTRPLSGRAARGQALACAVGSSRAPSPQVQRGQQG
jgi:hypothetical protein